MKTILALLCLSLDAPAGAQGLSIRSPFYVAEILKPAAAAPAGPSFPSSGLIHYWALGEAAGNGRVDSVGSLTLTERTTTVASGTGIRGNAADFTGNSLDSLTNLTGALIGLDYPFSMSAWVKTSDNTPTATCEVISVDNGGGVDVSLKPNGNIEVIVGSDGDVFPAMALGANSVWHLIVLSCPDLDNVRLSVDAATFTTGNSYNPPQAGAGEFSIGYNGTYFAFDGLIDEVGIWDRALTQQEVTDLWNGGTGIFFTP